jgi:hypothetical protein
MKTDPIPLSSRVSPKSPTSWTAKHAGRPLQCDHLHSEGNHRQQWADGNDNNMLTSPRGNNRGLEHEECHMSYCIRVWNARACACPRNAVGLTLLDYRCWILVDDILHCFAGHSGDLLIIWREARGFPAATCEPAHRNDCHHEVCNGEGPP